MVILKKKYSDEYDRRREEEKEKKKERQEWYEEITDKINAGMDIYSPGKPSTPFIRRKEY